MLFYTFQIILSLVTYVNAHSWVEQMTVIAANGTFIGAPGYARGNYLRTAPGFSDLTMTYLIPPDGRTNVNRILSTDKLCKSTQQNQTQTKGSPRLRASAGDAIALRYQENGHVTLPQNQPGKPPNRGTVYVYGTTQPKIGETLLDVHGAWNVDGTGGDRRGVLLSKQNFDDGRCYQINNGNISEYRQEKFPHQANQLMGADLWCQQDIQLPATASSGKLYTLYWVWDWPTSPGVDPTYPQGKKEIYTTCMDVEVEASSTVHAEMLDHYASGQDLNRAAIPSEFADLAGVQTAQAASDTASPTFLESTSTLFMTFTSTVGPDPTTVTAWQTMLKTVTVTGCATTVTA
ncbi:uncharacterized protein N7459_008706 [Penicillium hispanicum]|uniref:uncharacterized protein n=1 Tax=Penicillium hispanicum TaxID=1080232 RepID=UPI00253FF13B|nr:uncharacterized protein N7459_008706 [Penicillium hispanicum]KAJ5574279.1 hypothetical protein N7459_008706 [Penicillium hispanicum]